MSLSLTVNSQGYAGHAPGLLCGWGGPLCAVDECLAANKGARRLCSLAEWSHMEIHQVNICCGHLWGEAPQMEKPVKSSARSHQGLVRTWSVRFPEICVEGQMIFTSRVTLKVVIASRYYHLTSAASTFLVYAVYIHSMLERNHSPDSSACLEWCGLPHSQAQATFYGWCATTSMALSQGWHA
jgi:hypothetical protein